jgi:hypothetical protein
LKGPISVRSRGRKPAGESRALEIRLTLAKWRRVPDEQRVSLRALAVELGTSHQLLCSYLRTLDEWLSKERSKEHHRLAQEISDRAAAEGRLMTPLEGEQIVAYSRESLRSTLDSVISSAADTYTREMRKALKAGKMTEARKLARLLARTGSREGQEQLLRMHAKRKK